MQETIQPHKATNIDYLALGRKRSLTLVLTGNEQIVTITNIQQILDLGGHFAHPPPSIVLDDGYSSGAVIIPPVARRMGDLEK